MVSNEIGEGTLHAARPEGGDLVDRFLEGRLRAALFGAAAEVQLGRLRLEGTLGRGAMGAILTAFDPVLDRHVAIKSLLPGHGDDRHCPPLPSCRYVRPPSGSNPRKRDAPRIAPPPPSSD